MNSAIVLSDNRVVRDGKWRTLKAPTMEGIVAHAVTAVLTAVAVVEGVLLHRALTGSPRSGERRVLAVCIGGMAVFSLFAAISFQAPTAASFRASHLIAIAGLFAFYPATLDLVYRLARNRRLPWTGIVATYGPAMFFLAATVSGHDVAFGGFHYAPGRWWVFEPQTDLWWRIPYAAYGLAIVVVTWAMLFRWYRRTASHRERLQARAILIGITVSAVLQWGEFLVMSRVPRWEFPSMTPILAVLWVAGLYVAMRRYNLLDLRPEWIVEQAFDSVPQGILLLDLAGRVTYENREAASIVGDGRCTGRWFAETTPGLMDWIGSEQRSGEFRRVCVYAAGKTLVHGRAVSDRFGDAIGFMVFLHPGPDNAMLARTFGLSNREAQVYRELLTGQTLRSIASRLGITERTVKAHVHRIYEKTGAANRAALAAGAWSIR